MSFGDTFKALSDPTRREILNLLKRRSMTAGQIVEHFDTTGATISHHLNILRQAGLIEDRKSGKYIYYELNTTVFQEVLSWLQSLMEEDKKHEKNNRKISKWDVLYWILAFVPFIVSVCFYNRLPEQVPTHWGSDNVVNGYSSRNMAAFGIPAFMFLMAVMVNVIYRIDPKRENISRSRELKEITRWFVVLLAVMVQFVIVLSGIGMDINVGSMVSIPIALMFVAAGNYLPKWRQNYTMGIKLPWTLADEDNWNRTHRMAGYVWTAGGILMLIMGFFIWHPCSSWFLWQWS